MKIFDFDTIKKNIAGKGENAGYQHFLLFPQCLQKPSFFRAVKSRDRSVRANAFPLCIIRS